MIKRTLYLAAVLTSLTGCVTSLILGTDAHVTHLKEAGLLRLDPADNANYDYKLYISSREVGAPDMNDKNNRMIVAQTILRHQCQNVTLVSEKVIEDGKGNLGKRFANYYMNLKCIR